MRALALSFTYLATILSPLNTSTPLSALKLQSSLQSTNKPMASQLIAQLDFLGLVM